MNQIQRDEISTLIAIFDQDFAFESQHDQQAFEAEILKQPSFLIKFDQFEVWFCFGENYPEVEDLTYRIVKYPQNLNLVAFEKKLTELEQHNFVTFGQENTLNYVELIKTAAHGSFDLQVRVAANTGQISGPTKYSRYWIWTHHLRHKKANLIKTAKKLKLSGFCTQCKPGVILVEGPDQICQDFWNEIRLWSWQSIKLRDVQENLLAEDLKFTAFTELIDCVTVIDKDKKHLNYEIFQKYLQGIF